MTNSDKSAAVSIQEVIAAIKSRYDAVLPIALITLFRLNKTRRAEPLARAELQAGARTQ